MLTERKNNTSLPDSHIPPAFFDKDTKQKFDTAEYIEQAAQETRQQIPQTKPDPVIIEIIPGYEVAIDIWSFKFNTKIERWLFSGMYWDGVLKQLHQQGFHKRYRPDGNSIFFLQSEGNIISEVISPRLLDKVTAYVNSDQEPLQISYCKATYQARSEKLKRQAHLLFNSRFLENLITHERPILTDTDKVCHLPFRNGVVEVSDANGINLKAYTDLSDSCVWKGQVIQRTYTEGIDTDCHFSSFIANVSNGEADRINAFRTAIGYLLHSYNSPADGQAVICYDEQLTDRRTPQGGTGKGVFANAIRQLRPAAAIDGRKFDPKDRFCFQQVGQDTRIVWIDDPNQDFSLERFFSALTEGWTIEKKNQPAYKISQREGPKLLISTNTILSNEGSSNIRRQFILEFSDHYQRLIRPDQKTSPIIEQHGCTFFTDDWDADEWAKFDAYMVDCVLLYLQEGQLQYQTRNVASNRLIQTTGEDFYEWATTYEEKGLQPNVQYKTADLFLNFKARFFNEEIKQRGFANSLKKYAANKGWVYKSDSMNSIPVFTLKRD